MLDIDILEKAYTSAEEEVWDWLGQNLGPEKIEKLESPETNPFSARNTAIRIARHYERLAATGPSTQNEVVSEK